LSKWKITKSSSQSQNSQFAPTMINYMNQKKKKKGCGSVLIICTKERIHKNEGFGLAFLVFTCLDFTHPMSNPIQCLWTQIKPKGNNSNVHLFGFHSPNPISPKNYENNSSPKLLENFPMSLHDQQTSWTMEKPNTMGTQTPNNPRWNLGYSHRIQNIHLTLTSLP
jgi:hypothetical protein